MPRHFSDRDLAIIRNKMGENIPVPPKPRRSPRAEESRIQCAVVKWWDLVGARKFDIDHRLLYAVPNGHQRDAVTGAILKREGLRAGAPDLNLDVPCGGYHGIRVELKTLDGVVSKDQREFHPLLKEQGYCVVLAFGYDQAVMEISRYLSL